MPDEKPAEPTEAQEAEESKEEEAPTPSLVPGPAAVKAQAEDDRWRAEHPNEPRVRGPVEGVGGESFAVSDNSDG